MISVDATVQTLLETADEVLMADLYTFTLVNGTVLRFTTSDRDISYGDNTFSSSGPVIKRSHLKIARGLEVDDLKLEISPKVYPYSCDSSGEQDNIGSLSWPQAINAGLLADATVQLDLAVFSSWESGPVGIVQLFIGNIGKLEMKFQKIEAEVKCVLQKLITKLPRRLVQPGCTNKLYDNACGLDRVVWRLSSEIEAGSSSSSLIINSGMDDNYYTFGYLEIVTGANAGQSRLIKSQIGSLVTVLPPLLSLPAEGDEVYLYPGCDKKKATCEDKFDNLANFIGFPYVPEPEVIL